MPIDNDSIMKHLEELRELADRKLVDDPLPTGWDATERLRGEIEKHDLAENIVQLELDGYTILPPGKAAPPELFERIRQAILRLAKERPTGFGAGRGLGQTLFHMLPHDRAFEEALMAPAPGAILTYLLGHRAELLQSTGLIKKAGGEPLGIHADHSGMPGPWPRMSQLCVVTWVLSDYTRENGAVCVWPGSHRRAEPVPEHLQMAHDHPAIKVLEPKAGSVIVWHGSLWHGALPRETDGQRMTLVLPFARGHMKSSELYWATATPEMIERNPRRFATFMGLHSYMPWFAPGPDGQRIIVSRAEGSVFE